MNARVERQPGPDHPIEIQSEAQRVIVRAAGRVIADSRNALRLTEASYPAALYIPRNDVDMSQLLRTNHSSYCPYKGDCSYYSIRSGGEKAVNAAWSYEKPYAAVARIDQHLAFYSSRVDSVEIGHDPARMDT